MAKQAKVLTDVDAKRILAVIAQDRYAERNRALFMVSYLAGLRACEIASLTIGSVLTPGALRANDDETSTRREFSLEGVEESSRGHAQQGYAVIRSDRPRKGGRP